MTSKFTVLLASALTMFVTGQLSAQEEPPADRKEKAGGKGEARKPKKDSKSDIKPYDEVITEKAVTATGIIDSHRLDDKLYFEIPADVFGKEFLWVTQIAKTQAGYGHGGTSAGNRVVRFEMRDEKVLLRDVKFSIRAEVDDTITNAVEATSLEPIIKTFDVAAWGKDKAPVINVTDLFTGDVQEFSAKRALGASGIDKSRTFLEEVKSFPENIEVKVLATYKTGGSSTSSRRRTSGRRDSSLSAVTALIHHSIVKLPDSPMAPRKYDSRVGFFTVSFEDYGSEKHEVERVQFITRWRLDKKDPNADVSEPVKPIVFYVGRGVPEKWRPWVRKGIEAWQPSFEAAGFKNAILAKDAPTKREDPDWDAEDARYSTIRWLPSSIENAMGPHVHDPRTGEILESDIIVYHNILKLVRDWYFVQASPMDSRAQQLPMPDDLIGELLAYVISHEVGHTLGFPHNMKASSAYSIEELRNPEFTAMNGTEASIMDYGRFNYVAQPGDDARLIPVIGPYDFFAIEWGYRDFGNSEDWAEDKKELDNIVARQVDDVMLRFGNPNASVDPSQQTEDLGSDPIAATDLGLKNLDRVAGFLVSATCKPGKNYDLLSNMYSELLSQRDRELNHVASMVGGMVANNLWFGDSDSSFDPVDGEQQRAAVAFLIDKAFTTPTALLTPDIVDRLQVQGTVDRVLSSQRGVLSNLISESRLKRMAEHSTRQKDAYLPEEFLSDVRGGIWSELTETRPEVDVYRRALQRAHVDTLSRNVATMKVDSDLPAISRKELETLLQDIGDAMQRSTDEATRIHLADMSARIDTYLEPRSARPVPGSGASSIAGPKHETGLGKPSKQRQ